MRTGKPYTQVELDFIRAHADLRPRQLAELFNATFGRSAEPKRMSQKLRAMGIEPNVAPMHKYNDEQIAWLAANATHMGEKALCVAFNAKYGAKANPDSLATYVRKYTGAKKTREAKFESRSKAQRKYKVGDLSIQNRGGRLVKVIRVDDKREWEQYGRYLWEREHGKLPDDWVVVFLNNDATDCRPENMWAISPYVSALMARNRWYSENPNVTLVAIRLCELAQALRGQIRI